MKRSLAHKTKECFCVNRRFLEEAVFKLLFMIKNVSLFIALPSILSASFDKPYQCIKSDFCFQAEIYLFKFNNKNTRKRCEICSKLTIKAPERRHWHRSSVFIVNFWTYFMPFSSVSIVWRRRTGKILFDLSFLALMMRSRIIVKKLQIFVTQLLEKNIHTEAFRTV